MPMVFLLPSSRYADQIERYGGAPGVRDKGQLEAALYRPQTGYYAGLIEEAAALWESLAQNHPFLDGNKRTAFAATYTFLAINGARLTADAEKTHAFVIGLYEANQFSFEKLVPWLRRNVEPSPGKTNSDFPLLLLLIKYVALLIREKGRRLRDLTNRLLEPCDAAFGRLAPANL